MKKIPLSVLAAVAVASAYAERTGPWTKEQAWAWYDKQPWIRGCNYMPASAANRVDQWQAAGSEARFEEMEREFALAESIGFNAMRLIVEEQGFGVWYYEHDSFMANFERALEICAKHKIRAIVVLGNDCSRPKPLWKLPKPGPQPNDWGYHGGRKLSQHGSFPNAVGYTVLDDPELNPEFYRMCEELLVKYREDARILFWNVWNEPGNNNRGDVTGPYMRKLFGLAWKIDPLQPLAADVWEGEYGAPEDPIEARRIAGELSDIVSYHSYSPFAKQVKIVEKLKKLYGRPMINTEWLARTLGCDVFDCYPFFAQNRIGCTMWGFVAGKYQTYEPWEWMWNRIERDGTDAFPMQKWFHDLYRPSLRPYDPKEVEVIKNINAQMDAELKGESVRAKIVKAHKILAEDMWHEFRRTKFDFNGRTAWVVEPGRAPRKGTPWTWTMQWAESFVERTGVTDLLDKGFHHVTLEAFETRASDASLPEFAAFQKFLVEELGFSPKANLAGMSWGGFFSVRYAAAYPENVAKIYLDAPLLNFEGFGAPKDSIGPWTETVPADGNWREDLRMPVNKADAIAKAGIPVLLLWGGADRVVAPEVNCELFAARFKEAGGGIKEVKRDLYGHHPHGLDPDQTKTITDFFLKK